MQASSTAKPLSVSTAATWSSALITCPFFLHPPHLTHSIVFPLSFSYSHCLKFYLYSCICACGLVAGPTRKAIRSSYDLPVAPEFLKDQGANADCLTLTIPCINCFALCQDAREINSRNPSGPLKPTEFTWGIPPADDAPAAAATTTTAPAQAEMTK